ncbi:MAG: hypothetical protein ACKOTB_01090, partial [Planctomycetia bacterium]
LVVNVAITVFLAASGTAAIAVAADKGFRVESEVFVEGAEEPVSRSLTLFRDGIAWDFLESLGGEGAQRQAGGHAAREIVLHDPARERVILIDPARKLKTQIETVRLERLSASLATWARKSDDRLVRWAGGPDFGEGMTESRERIELVGPRVRYTVDWIEAPSPEAAADYRRFADTAILLKALVRPGGLPPFARLAINRRVSAADGIPSAVTLEIDSRAALVTGRSESLRSTHKLHPRLLTGDIDRIEEAESLVALAADVDLAAFMNAAAPAE